MNKSEKYNRSENTQQKHFKVYKRAIITKVIRAFQQNPKKYEKTGTLGKDITNTKETARIDKETIRIIPFTGER